ncbi:MAG: MBL fold metallo-hydrolase [Cyclobacteriaceae bacterium]|nr:MBL fold metallo-hydrolase [Cyclobacteriaceae bacterium]
MTIKQFEFNAFSENTFVVYDDTKECVIIDPGCYEPNEKAQLKKFIKDNNLIVTSLINTHCHIDHVLGNKFIKDEFDVGLTIHKLDIDTLKANDVVAPIYGFQAYESSEADIFIDEGEQVKFGNSVFDVLFVPGHAPGHIALVNETEKICIAGDVLFQQSIGRTDLPGGDYDTLMESIKNKLFKLADDVTVYCGHGPNTNIGYEKQYNPFCGTVAN